jgi:acyl-CoA thioester hydrolase
MMKNEPVIAVETETTIEFFNCDPMKVVWHGNYLNFFELGRRVLLDSLEFGYDDMADAGFAFPVVEIRAKYLAPLRFKDTAKIRAALAEYENCLRIEYQIFNAETGAIVCKGYTVQMALDVAKNESCFTCPQIFIDKVEAAIKRNSEK